MPDSCAGNIHTSPIFTSRALRACCSLLPLYPLRAGWACVTSCTARGLAGIGAAQIPVAIIADCGGDAVLAVLAGLSVHAITPWRSIGAITARLPICAVTAIRTVFAVFYDCFGRAAFVGNCNFCAVCALLYACSGAISVSTRSPIFAFQFIQRNQIFPRAAVIGAILDVSSIRPHGDASGPARAGSRRLVNGRHKGFFGFGGQVVKIANLLLHGFQRNGSLAHQLLPCRSARLRHGAVLRAAVAAHAIA